MQEQTLTQTITISYGDLASTGSPFLLALLATLVLLAFGLTLFLLRNHLTPRIAFTTHSLRSRINTTPFRILSLFLALGLLLTHNLSPVLAAPTLTLASNQQNLTISIPEASTTTGTTTAEATTTITTSTLNDTGYTLTASLTEQEPGIGIELKGGEVTDFQALEAGESSTVLTLATTDVANDPDSSDPNHHNTTDITLKFTVDSSVTPGTKELKLTYRAVDNAPAPIVINPNTCRNADPTSACDMEVDAAMIPITYTGNETDGPEWRKANTAQAGDWYDYETKHWANAVTVTSASLASYQSAPAGTVIDEADVLGYYVYIPRYEYQVCRPNASDPITLTAGQCQDGSGNDVLSTAAPYDFNIRFQKANQTTAFDGITVGNWATHPAFTFGTTELAGVWVGKYETSSPDTITSTGTANTAVANGHVRIKPNQNGINYQNVSTQFATAQSFTDSSSPNYQGLNQATTDTRMLRDYDWGAVTYLATSGYGKSASEEVYINNCKATGTNYNGRTGWGGATASASQTTACQPGSADNAGAYHTAQGQQASTTGNTTGIYDMSGGNYEYTLGNFNNVIAGSGFGALPAAKYLNTYLNPPFAGDYYTNNNLCTWTTCGGSALHETKSVLSVMGYNKSWRSGDSGFVYFGPTWFSRGGRSDTGSTAGLFATSVDGGGASLYAGLRVLQSWY